MSNIWRLLKLLEYGITGISSLYFRIHAVTAQSLIRITHSAWKQINRIRSEDNFEGIMVNEIVWGWPYNCNILGFPLWLMNAAHYQHDDVIKWKYFPCYCPFLRGIHRSPVNFPHKGQGRGALMFSLICAWINGWVNDPEAGVPRRYGVHYDVTVMTFCAEWW